MKNFSKLVEPGDRVLVLPDMHINHYTNTAWPQVAMALTAAKRLGAKKLLQLGDLLDMAQVSPHRSAGEDPGSFEECDRWHNAFIDSVLHAGIAPMLRLEGNHDAPSAWLAESNLGKLAKLETLVPSIRRWRNYAKLGEFAMITSHLFAIHGDSLSGSDSVNSAQQVLAKNPGMSVVYGHVHRLSVAYSTTTHPVKGKSTHVAFTPGHLTSDAFDTGNRKLRKFAATHANGCALITIGKNGAFHLSIGAFTDNGSRLFLGGIEVTAKDAKGLLVK